MVQRDYKKFPRKSAPRGAGGGIRQWNRVDFLGMLAAVLALVSLYYLAGHFFAGRRMRVWAQVPAHVESLAIHKFPSRSGDIPRIACHYNYEYQGISRHGRRLSILGEKDNP